MPALLLVALTACARPAPQPPTAKKAASVRLRAFVEAGAARAVVSTRDFLFVAMHDGLDRVHHQSGERVLLTKDDGLPGNMVYAMALETSGQGLWMATDGGIARLDMATASVAPLRAAPEIFNMGALDNTMLAAARDGGLWIGTTTGLFYVSAQGVWSQTAITSRVNSILEDPAGTLWIAAEEGLLSVGADRVAQELEDDVGCAFFKVLDLSQHDADAVLVLAEDETGTSVLALARDKACTTYGVPAASRWSALASFGGRSYLLGARKLQSIGPADAGGHWREERHLRATSSKPGVPESLRLTTLRTAMPAGATNLAAGAEGVFVGTSELGVLSISGPGKERWIRRRELVADAREMSVACQREGDCFIALGTRRFWRWNGTGFVDEGTAQTSHFVLRLADGRVLLLRDAAGPAQETRVEFFLREQDAWQQIKSIAVETPGQRARIRTARQSPDGLIWISLAYDDGPGEADPFGVAAVDLELGAVWYHRASFDRGAMERGILPVPVDVSGIAFLGADEVWLSSSQGATRVVGDDIIKHNESDGLLSEILNVVVCASGGMVYTGSKRGVGEWDGKSWNFPGKLRTAIHDLAIGIDGRLWLATDRGIGIYDGARTRRLDARRGLLDNVVLDLETDHFGRVWARSEQGLVLITP